MRTIDHDVKIIAPIATLLAFPGNEHNFRPAHGAQRGGSVRPSRRRPDRRPRSFRGEYSTEYRVHGLRTPEYWASQLPEQEPAVPGPMAQLAAGCSPKREADADCDL